MKGKGITLM